MQPKTTLESTPKASYYNIYSEDSANVQYNISFIKEINRAHTFALFTLGLTQGQICPEISQTLFSKEKTL